MTQCWNWHGQIPRSRSREKSKAKTIKVCRLNIGSIIILFSSLFCFCLLKLYNFTYMALQNYSREKKAQYNPLNVQIGPLCSYTLAGSGSGTCHFRPFSYRRRYYRDDVFYIRSILLSPLGISRRLLPI
jgi:hypothetical protein